MSGFRGWIVCVAVAFALTPSGRAAVVTVLNVTGREVAFTIEHPGGKREEVKLGVGESRAVPVGRTPVMRLTLNGKPAAFTLDPYTPYLFVEPKPGELEFGGVKLVADLPPADDVPQSPAAAKPPVISVAVYADDANPFTREAWEKKLRERVADAAAVLRSQAGVRLEVTGVGEWSSAGDSPDLPAALADFRLKADAKAGTWAVGFLSRAVPGDELGAGGEPGSTHLVVREGKPATDVERVEVLVQQFGRQLGAVRSPDRGSVMRSRLGDGQAVRSTFRVQFDPINLLVVNVWAEELAAGRGPKLADLRPKARARLFVYYKTLADIHAQLKTGDTQAQEYTELADLVRDRAAEEGGQPANPVPVGEPAEQVPADDPKKPLSAEQLAVRTVVQAVTRAAAERKSDGPKGDDLTAVYVRAAAAAADGLDEKVKVRGFLLGLGIALDDSSVLRDKPVLRSRLAAAETDAEREERLAVLGRPTMRGRRDLCQHFAVSAALTDVFGAEAAELAGVSKELLDMKGVSGFSFADLAADLAGIEFTKMVEKEPKTIGKLAAGFAVADYLPDVKPFREGLAEQRFQSEYGSAADKRFRTALEEVRTAVRALPAYSR